MEGKIIKKFHDSLKFLSENTTLLYLALCKFLIHFFTNLGGGYGFFRDEFYYIACSNHLDWGFVDQPPLSLALLKVSRWLFGDSLVSIRLLPALAGAATVFITGLMVKKLGGGRFAQILAGISVIIAPLFLGINNYFSMNSFDMFFWALAAYIIVLIVKGGPNQLWLFLGVILGLGAMNKISMLWFGFGLVIGLIVTDQRKFLRTKWPWLSGLVAFVMFLPHLVWQVVHQWPTLEFIRNAFGQKMAAISPLNFLTEQILSMHPMTLPVWLSGLIYLLFFKKGKQFRILAIIYIAILLLLILNQKSRPSYLAPAYPMLFAAGAMVIDELIRKLNWKGIKTAIISAFIFGGILIAPLALPVLPVETYIKYADLLGQQPSTEENKEIATLPQHYADMFGWEEMVATIAGVYRTLSKDEQSQCLIFTDNYGEAGAVDFLGPKYNLPGAISGHNNYWLWGPGDVSPKVMIFFSRVPEETLKQMFKEVRRAAIFTCQYCMPYENNKPVYVCKYPYTDLNKMWQRTKSYN